MRVSLPATQLYQEENACHTFSFSLAKFLRSRPYGSDLTPPFPPNEMMVSFAVAQAILRSAQDKLLAVSTHGRDARATCK